MYRLIIIYINMDISRGKEGSLMAGDDGFNPYRLFLQYFVFID